jgi:dethiobiotin synthetase
MLDIKRFISMRSDLFVTGTDTNVGKTVLSALLCAALGHVYWKPIQTGTREGSDREAVMRYAAIPETQTAREVYRFDEPVSPHLAALMAGTRIELDSIVRPAVPEPIVIEGAGGVLVPVNEKELMIDVMRRLAAPIVLAARTSLGTINHTLLSVRAVRDARLDLKGVVMIGEPNQENRRAIEHYGKVRVIGEIPPLPRIDRAALLEIWHSRFSA